MSWFDKGLKVLLEAQKQIDKALDIQENVAPRTEDTNAKHRVGKRTPGGANREKKCKTDPNTPVVEENTTSSWGSFSGSFFENPNANSEMVTKPPKASADNSFPTTSSVLNVTKRQSVTSNSDSVELLTPSSPCSELLSATDTAINTSESVELITASPSGEIISPDSKNESLNESIVIIASHEVPDEEDDSMSCNTVMENTLTPFVDTSSLADTASATSMTHATSIRSNISTSTVKSLTDDLQTIDSDSTQSFEDIQMLTSSTKNSIKNDTLYELNEDKNELSKLTFPTSSSNSNDEMETTTSSDIEIISNPNGDSSSTNSTTPLKLKKLEKSQTIPQSAISKSKKGHCREPSEISILSEDSQSEVDKLVQRICELNEVLESRELRLLEFERQHCALKDRNNELQLTIDSLKNNTNLDSAEEYTQRLSALEKKFQASIRERDTLRAQIKNFKDELQNHVPKEDLMQIIADNNTMVDELRLEGEKLSKEILLQSNIIKKLRTKEKSTDSLLKKNKEQLESITDEVERLKKTLNAKEEVERSQIEAVHKMSSENRKLDEENAQLRSKIEDMQSKLMTVQTNFEAVKIELQQRACTSEEALGAKKEMEHAKAEKLQLTLQLSETREQLRFYEQALAKREHQLREENKELLTRLEAAELRAETSTQEASLTTIPLIRQLESLQNTLTVRTANWNKEEKLLLDKLNVSQGRLKSLETIENTFKDKLDMLQARCLELEEKLSYSLMQEEDSKICLHQTQMDYSIKESNMKKEIIKLNETLVEYVDKLKTLEEAKQDLEQKVQTLKDTKLQRCDSLDNLNQRLYSTNTFSDMSHSVEQQQRSQSPTMSLGANSIEEVIGVGTDCQIDDFDCISNSGLRHGTGSILGMHLNLMGNNTSTLERLQSMLKQRDGELTHLQWELSRMQAERDVLNGEITNLTMEIENIKEKLQNHEQLDKNFNDLQHRYDALLQMYGEKVERTDELELDLIELKEAYKTQIDELLAQPRDHT